MKQSENRTWFPAWLEYSGLPVLLASKTKSVNAWCVFKKIVELDCERNTFPGTVEISLVELEERCGVNPSHVRKACTTLRKQKLIACFLPDNDEEAALFRIVVPLETPVSAGDIRRANPHLFEQGREWFRYSDNTGEVGTDENLIASSELKEVVDLYFDVVGLKMNAFILDELRMLPERFETRDIKSVFAMARKNEIRSLRWVMQELVRRRSKSDGAKNKEKSVLLPDNNDEMRF